MFIHFLSEKFKNCLWLESVGRCNQGSNRRYIPGCEFAHCVPDDQIWNDTQKIIQAHEALIAQGQSKASYIQAIIFKHAIGEDIFQTLSRAFPAWQFVRTDTNPLPLNHKRAKGRWIKVGVLV